MRHDTHYLQEIVPLTHGTKATCLDQINVPQHIAKLAVLIVGQHHKVPADMHGDTKYETPTPIGPKFVVDPRLFLHILKEHYKDGEIYC